MRALAQRFASQSLTPIQTVKRLINWHGRWSKKQLAALRQLDLAVAVGQQPTVPDTLESRWQVMPQEATHELRRLQAHDLGLDLLAVVLPPEVDRTAGEIQQSVV